MTKFIVGLVLAVVGLLVVLVAYFDSPLKRKYARIEVGMSSGHVEAILGKSHKAFPLIRYSSDQIHREEWYCDDGTIIIEYDSDGNVTEKRFVQYSRRSLTKELLDIICKFL